MEKKRRTWLWIIGWILIFPVPFTILMMRNKNISKKIRTGAVAAAWLVYAAIGLFENGNDDVHIDSSAGSFVAQETGEESFAEQESGEESSAVQETSEESFAEQESSEESFAVQEVVEETVTEKETEEFVTATTVTDDYNMLEVHYVDVGQGDCTLLKCGGQTMVIDCGDTDKGTTIQYYLKNHGVDTIDYLVLTHLDADHIGGAPVIITKFDIGSIYISNYKEDNKTYENVMNAITYRSYSWSTPVPGDTVMLGSATVTFLAPSKEYDDSNNSSIALTVRYGNTSFLFSGDAEEEAEKDIVETGLDIDVDVYQVGHHGSSTSSSIDFLTAMSPEYAVISCAEGNSYGHPHAETLDNLRSMGTQVFRTDEQGSIVAMSDGETITWNCTPSESWQTGEKTDSSSAATDESASDEQTGGSSAESDAQESTAENVTYVLNTNTKKYHLSTCHFVQTIADKNRQDTTMSKEEIEALGYVGCKNCNP